MALLLLLNQYRGTSLIEAPKSNGTISSLASTPSRGESTKKIFGCRPRDDYPEPASKPSPHSSLNLKIIVIVIVIVIMAV